MIGVYIDDYATFDEWRLLARKLLAAGIKPEAVNWNKSSHDDLFESHATDIDDLPIDKNKLSQLKVSKQFVNLASYALCHNSPERFAVLYKILWRLQENPRLINHVTDPDILQANQWAKSVGRDKHKMRAFVRFKELTLKNIAVDSPQQVIFTSWFEPEHYSLKLNIPFFTQRFHNMDWSIHTHYLSIHWHNKNLFESQGIDKDQLPQHDAYDHYWQVYYASIFNPARLKVKAMCNEMPKKYWKNLPEAQLIKPLIQSSTKRMEDMFNKSGTDPKLPERTRFTKN